MALAARRGPFLPDELAKVRARLLEEHEGDGRWRSHLGDATAWAPAFLLAAPDASPEERRAAEATIARERRLLAGSLADPKHREEAALGVLGLVASARTRPFDAAAARAALAAANAAALAQGGYLARPAATFDATSVTAGLAYGNLLMASALKGPARILHGRTAEWILERLLARAVVDGYARADPSDRHLKALPNLLLVAALARAGRLRRKRALVDEAKRIEQAVRGALWDGDVGAFLASEEAEPQYLLSVQNFAALAYAELDAADPRSGSRGKASAVLHFATRRLLDGALLAHHWNPEEGRANWHCTGCNWQTLYVAGLLARR